MRRFQAVLAAGLAVAVALIGLGSGPAAAYETPAKGSDAAVTPEVCR